MNIKKFVLNSLLLAIGALLHQITPPLFLGMKPDFSLIMLFIVIIIDKNFNSCIASGLATGIFTAITTSFPGGQIPNIIDKLVTTIIIYIVVKALRGHINNQILMIFSMSIGTIISGTIFLSTAALMFSLPGEFIALFISIVLPAVLINVIVGIVLFNAINISMKRSNFKME